ncbi:MAG: DNA-binding response regulator [Candidatus Omnitrophica bacterium CG1_02_46_14]|nr:MAG: DNA-binding response regulator [Candidatus Omnitrophica bacterium CG1_02_46_14]
MSRKTVLVVDDEKDILNLLRYNLEKEGYQVLSALTGEIGLDLAKNKKPELILLDLMLPGIDGLEVCKILKSLPETKHIPIIMLTAKSSEIDQVVGLELGASDYISKPFSVKVLLARVKNVLRKESTQKAQEVVLKIGDFVLDKEQLSIRVQGKPLLLTKLEFKILGFLMENPGKVLSRDKLLNGAWGEASFVVDRTVDVHIRSIRQKLGKHRVSLETVRGFGYRFVNLKHEF